MIPGSVNPLLFGASGGYQIPYSLRFRASNSAYLYRTPASSGNQKTFTMSSWVKRGALGSAQGIFGSNFNFEYLSFNASNQLELRAVYPAGDFVTTAVFRDPSAWLHVVCAIDTTQSTSTNRVKLWVNGVQITSWVSTGYPSLNATTTDWNTNKNTPIGAQYIVSGPVGYFDGYLAEVYWIDGQALTPSSFSQTDATTGVWVPKKYSETYGNNGFYLKFADASAATAAAIGKDSSGNGNNWTPSGISVTSGTTFDQMTDTPTLNYAVLSPLDKSSVVTFAYSTLGITGGSAGGGDTFSQTAMTFGLPTTGKWYLEFKRDTAGSDANGIGVNITRTNRGGNGWPATRGITGYTGYYAFEYGFNITHDVASNNLTYRNNNAALNTYSTASTASSAIYGFAVDCDSSLVYMYENGVLLTASGGLSFTHPGGQAVIALFKSDLVASINCGQRPFAYTPPTGFKALNTTNLPTPSIKKGSLYMDATTRTGTGATASVSSLNFQPDLVWIKSRSAATDHGLYDAVRGVQKQLESNQAAAETTETTGLTAFNSNGYTVGALAQLNTSAATYVDWAWKEGVTPGFDSFVFSGNATNRTVSHGLGAVPHFMIFKNRNTANGWIVYHRNQNASPATGFLQLQASLAFISDSTVFNNTAPTSSVFSLGTDISANGSGTNNIIAYLWSEVEGFSKISSYTGNGSTDGPFVFCGFRPRYVLIKSTGAENWSVQDSARNPFNVVDARLKPNSADAEAVSSVQNVDFLSNGFKIRTTDPEKNGSSTTYIFAAYAENPFKYARAR